MENLNLDGVEIFATGKWNGDEFTEADLDGLVQSFEETRDHLKPYVKLGHGEGQKLLAADELPAAGWINRVYRHGGKLLADIRNVPRKIHELIKRTAYARVSSEIFTNIEVNGKKHPLALKAMSFLGGETPAVHTLDDILALYSTTEKAVAFETEATTRRFEFEANRLLEQHPQEGLKAMEEMKQEIAELKAANLKLAEENKALGLNVEAAKTEAKVSHEAVEKVEGELAKLQTEKRFAEITGRVDKLIQEKKIMPAQKDALLELLKNSEATKKFTLKGKEVDGVEGLILAFVDAGHEPLNTEEGSQAGKKQNVDLAEEAKVYAAKHSVSIKEATIAVAREKGLEAI